MGNRWTTDTVTDSKRVSDMAGVEVQQFLQKSRNPEELQAKIEKADTVEKVDFSANIKTSPVVFKAEDDFVIWGPASVEIVDKEGDLIEASALSDALPQLLKRARLSLEHSDQIVGEIIERFETGKSVAIEAAGTTFERSKFPTDVLELDGIEPALYVAGKVWNDTRQARETREKINEGIIDSYSISGEALVTRTKVDNGEPYDEIAEIDLSAVTLCEDGMNQKAEFGLVTGDSSAISAGANTSSASNQIAASASDFGAVAQSALSKTMTEENESEDTSEDQIDLDAIEDRFKSAVQDELPDGEIATKDDVQETVEAQVEEQMKQHDRASEQDDTDDGQHGDFDDIDNPMESDHTATVERAVESVLEDYGVIKGDDEDDEEEDGDDELPFDDGEAEKSTVSLKDAAHRLERSFGVPSRDIVRLVRSVKQADADVEKVAELVKEVEIDDIEGDIGDDDGDEIDELDIEDKGEDDDDEEIENAREQIFDELKQDLPEDLWKVVSEYVEEEAAGGGEQVEASQTAKSASGEVVTEGDLEDAIQSVLKGQIADKQDGVNGATGAQTEQDTEPKFGKSGQDDTGSSHPALANIYEGGI